LTPAQPWLWNELPYITSYDTNNYNYNYNNYNYCYYYNYYNTARDQDD